MQKGWQHTAYHAEVPPPAGAWDSIAHTLDHAEQAEWQTTAYNAATMPPSGVWDSITYALDNAEQTAWQTTAYNAETLPPATIWAQVSAALDNTVATQWQQDMYQYEVAPPAAAWGNITATLDNAGGKLVQMEPAQRSQRKFYLRIAAAAAVVSVIALSAVWFSQSIFFNSDPQSIAGNQPAAVTPNTTTVNTAPVTNNPVTAPSTDVAAVPAAAPNKEAATVSRRTTAVKEAGIAPLEYVNGNEVAYLDERANPAIAKKLPDADGQVTTDITKMEAPAATGYITVSGPDGRSVRVSAKFASLLGYLNDTPGQEERLDVIIKESAVWKATFKQWRQKMMNNNIAPSFDNFMDVIELSKLLNSENK